MMNTFYLVRHGGIENNVAKRLPEWIDTPLTDKGLLRDMFVVRSVKWGIELEDALEKIGLSKNSFDYAQKRYGLLIREAL